MILKVDGETVETSSQVPVMIAGKKPGSSVAIEVWRNGSTKELSVRPVEIQEKGARVASNPAQQADETARLGLAVRPLTQQEKRQAETDGDLLVEDVDGPAAGGRRAARRRHPRRQWREGEVDGRAAVCVEEAHRQSSRAADRAR